MNDTLISCSSLGSIMTNPRSKTETLSKTCMDHLLEVYIKIKYGRKKEIDTKYFAKGNIAEGASIKMISDHYGEAYSKNDEFFENDFVKGFPDINAKSKVIEAKTPWDIFTFFKAKTSPINNDYYWQLQGYMDLTGHDNAQLVYCLVDTPEYLINQEKKRLSWNMDVVEDEELYYQKCEEIEKRMKYSDIPASEKIHIFNISRNQDDIDKMHDRVIECRNYLETLINPK